MDKVIHLVLGKANPNRMNGVNKVAHYHATCQHKLGIHAEIWGITETPDAPVIERDVPTRLFRSHSFFAGLDNELIQAIRKLDTGSVFHIHGALIHDFYLVSRQLAYNRIPYIYTPHGAFNEVALRKNKLLKKIYIKGFEEWMLKHAKKVQFLGQSEYDNISNLVTLDNTVIIPNGQSFEELSFEYNRVSHRIPPVFGFCGRLDNYYKGLDRLIEGFSMYYEKCRQGELWIVGDGPDRQMLEQKVIARNLAASVTFFGAEYGQDKLNHLANMDVFVHPSHSEGSPTAVLEAAALGLPLLVTTGTNVGHIVDRYQCGIHINNNDPATIAEALISFDKLYTNGELGRMKENARNMVEREFNWMNIARRLIEVYAS